MLHQHLEVIPEMDPAPALTLDPVVICTAVPDPLRQYKFPLAWYTEYAVVAAVTEESNITFLSSVAEFWLNSISAFTLIAAGVIRMPLFVEWSCPSIASREVFRFSAQVGPVSVPTAGLLIDVIFVPEVAIVIP